jgi:hypothetical protein
LTLGVRRASQCSVVLRRLARSTGNDRTGRYVVLHALTLGVRRHCQSSVVLRDLESILANFGDDWPTNLASPGKVSLLLWQAVCGASTPAVADFDVNPVLFRNRWGH